MGITFLIPGTSTTNLPHQGESFVIAQGFPENADKDYKFSFV